MRYVYPCEIHAEDGGGFWVTFPDVQGALTGGNTVQEALANAEDALVAALGAYFKLGEEVPLPGPPSAGHYAIPFHPVAAAKIALHRAMRERALSNVALGRKLGISETSVRRLLDPDHRSHIGSVETALRALGRILVIEDVAASAVGPEGHFDNPRRELERTAVGTGGPG